MIPYPTALPVNEMQDVIGTIRGRQFTSNSRQFAKDIWIISGYALEQSVGEIPTTFAVAQSSGPALTDEEACSHLEAACCQTAQALPGVAAVIPWKQLLHWALSQLVTLTA